VSGKAADILKDLHGQATQEELPLDPEYEGTA
jgi:hypothetical protein